MLWIEDSYFSRKQKFEVTNVLIIDLFISLVDKLHYLGIIVMFLSVFWTLILTKPIHSKLEDPLASKLCNVTFLQMFKWRNKLISILDGMRLNTFSLKFPFWGELFFITSAYYNILMFLTDFDIDILMLTHFKHFLHSMFCIYWRLKLNFIEHHLCVLFFRML